MDLTMTMNQNLDISKSNASKMQKLWVDDFNNSVGDLTGYDCPLCKNKGQIAVLRPDEDDEAYKTCECMQIRRNLHNSGLDTVLKEKASNLSGGQCQRLALARALLHDSPVYIFDEATSNIDVESENDIMEQIQHLAKTKTVILISHRLANVAQADNIYVLDKGSIAESGDHNTLLKLGGTYAKLWNAQQVLENYTKGGNAG